MNFKISAVKYIAHCDLSECDLNYFLDLKQTESISYKDKDLPPTAFPTRSNLQYIEY